MRTMFKAGAIVFGALLLVGVGASLGDNAPAPTPSPTPTPEVVYVTPPPTPTPTDTPRPTVDLGSAYYAYLSFGQESSARLSRDLQYAIDCDLCDDAMETMWDHIDEDLDWMLRNPVLHDCYRGSYDAYSLVLWTMSFSAISALDGDYENATDLMMESNQHLSRALKLLNAESCPW